MKIRNKFFLLSFAIWLVPFCARIPMDISYIHQLNSDEKVTNTIYVVQKALQENDNKKAFFLVFENNIKGCVINICGGVFLGVGTTINLAVNGFVTSDMFVCAYESGLPINCILKTTLPHCFELIGFWLSGAIGFMITRQLILFMIGRENFTKGFWRQLYNIAVVALIIILCAAYVETYISINMI